MSGNLIPAVVCLLIAVLAALIGMYVVLLARYACRLPQRIREHDARARANRRRREIDEAKWRELERRAELRAGLHRKLTGAA